LKKLIRSYKLFYDVDKYSLIFYVLGIMILVISFFVNDTLLELYPKESFIDRFASLSLVCFLVSEFRITSKTTEYILTAKEKYSDAVAKKLSFNTKELSKQINSLFDISIYTLSMLKIKPTSEAKVKESIKILTESIKSSKDRGSDIVKSDIQEKVILDLLVKDLNFIQIHILLFISISTILWGFGSIST
jgi:uncharacterized protein YdhG (YjbR/CyaY superfamily)